MKWSFRIGSLFGIPVFVHATFLLLLAWIGLVHWREEGSLAAAAAGIGFILALFGCVVLHEMGHALAARRFGIPTRDVTLLPIGGVARLERMPEEPWQELWVALAGPAVNVVIAAVSGVWLHLAGTYVPMETLSVTGGPFLERLMLVNVALVVFNLIPAFPMDGGRVLRALLASRLSYSRATQLAAGVGQAFAFLFGFLGLFSNPFLLFIALFVWIGAASEANMVETRTALAGLPVRQAMLTDFRALAPHDSLAAAVQLTLAGSQKDFPVEEGGQVVGILRQSDLLAGLSGEGPATPVAAVMQRDFLTVEASQMLETVFQRLQECECRTVPVLWRGALVGLLTMDNIGELLAIRAALDEGTEEPGRLRRVAGRSG